MIIFQKIYSKILNVFLFFLIGRLHLHYTSHHERKLQVHEVVEVVYSDVLILGYNYVAATW